MKSCLKSFHLMWACNCQVRIRLLQLKNLFVTFFLQESEDSDEELPTEEEVKKTEGWGILMKAMYEKYGRKSVVHKSTS